MRFQARRFFVLWNAQPCKALPMYHPTTWSEEIFSPAWIYSLQSAQQRLDPSGAV
jgi:hypothetical protein